MFIPIPAEAGIMVSNVMTFVFFTFGKHAGGLSDLSQCVTDKWKRLE